MGGAYKNHVNYLGQHQGFFPFSGTILSAQATSKKAPKHYQYLTPAMSPPEQATQNLEHSVHHGAIQHLVGVGHVLKVTLLSSPANYLLPFVALGIIGGALGWSSAAVFVLNFLAIFPLASLLSYSTDELSASVGQTFGGLINATFGNAVELIVSYHKVHLFFLSTLLIHLFSVAIGGYHRLGSRRNHNSPVQHGRKHAVGNSSGKTYHSVRFHWPILKFLEILGTCFFAAGYNSDTVKFNVGLTGLMSSLMVVSSASLIVPSVLDASSTSTESSGPDDAILTLSRVASIILLIFYLIYLYFQLKSHSDLFTEGEEINSEVRELGPWAASIVLIAATIGVTVCSDYLVDSIDGVVEAAHVSRAFVGLIIVPIVGNAGEYVTTVSASIKKKLDLAIGVIVGSTLQIALFVTPFLVVLGWIMDRKMSLRFDTFETTVLSLAVLVVNYLIQDGRTNYFAGALLIGS